MTQLLQKRLDKLSLSILKRESLLQKLSLYRLVSFFSIPLLGIIFYSSGLDILYSLGILISVSFGFYGIVYYYNQIYKYKQRLVDMKTFLEREIIRSEKKSKELFRSVPIPEDKIRHHSYAGDLNLFEKDGLFSLMDTTCTKRGESLFLGNLLQENAQSLRNSEILNNQKIVSILSDNPWFSYKFLRMGSEGWEFFLGSKWTTEAWRNSSSDFFSRRKFLKIIYPVYSVISFFAITSAILFQSPFGAPLFLLNLILFLTYRRDSIRIHKKWESAYIRLSETIRMISYLERFYNRLEPGLDGIPDDSGSRKKFIKDAWKGFIKSYSQLYSLPVPHFFANVLYLHDIGKVRRLEDWQGKYQSTIIQWVSLLEKIDSLHPLIHLRFMDGRWNFPEISDSVGSISGKAIAHPLLAKNSSVSNPMDSLDKGKVLLVTGSNMSGKTTFMRTVGTNILLGLMGGPVLAESMSFPPLRIVCSVKNQDSLTEGISLFYAEVRRLGEIFRSLESSSEPHLILLDEILKGTNTRERYLASEEILKKLQGKNSFTICTTHDLDLAKLPYLALKHFTENVEDNTMSFDYKIRDGVVQTTNALFILRREGVIA